MYYIGQTRVSLKRETGDTNITRLGSLILIEPIKNHPDKYKEIYTKANQRRKEAKREWYLKNKERLYAKEKERRANQEALSKAEKNFSSNFSLP